MRRSRSSKAKAPIKRRDELILDALERLLAKVPMSELDVEPIAAEAARFAILIAASHLRFHEVPALDIPVL